MSIQPINSFSIYQPNHKNKSVSGFQRAHFFNPISFTGDDYFNYDKRLKEKLEKRPGFKKLFGLGKKKLKNETTSELIGFNINQEALLKEKDQTIRAKEEILREKEDTLKIAQEKTALLTKQLEEAKNSSAKDEIIINLQKELAETEKKRLASMQELQEESAKINKIKKEQSILTKREAGKGWDKIAGCETLKMQLEEAFINKIAQEKAGYNVTMPNGILLYGQHGTGKTRFAQAFAEQADCNFVEIDTMAKDEDILLDLSMALKQSKRNYNSDGKMSNKRTIILLDDFNSIAQLSKKEEEELRAKGDTFFEDTCVGQLAQLLDNCADRYKATIIMTTNHPRKINSELMAANRIPYQIFLGPPNSLNAAKMFKYHLEGFTNQDIDYNKLGDKIVQALENDTAYSAQGIVNVVNNAKEKCQNSQITENDLLKSIEATKPDITSKTFNDFLDDMNEMLEIFNSDKKEV